MLCKAQDLQMKELRSEGVGNGVKQVEPITEDKGMRLGP